MKTLAFALAASGLLALSVPAAAQTWIETPEAKMIAAEAASEARADMLAKFGKDYLKPGQYLWDSDSDRHRRGRYRHHPVPAASAKAARHP